MAPKRKRNATEPVQPPASLAKARPKARLGKAASHVEAQKWFTKYDRDGNGVLDHDEYCDLLKSIGTEHDKLHPKYVEYFLKLTDGDGDGVVSLEEFTRSAPPRPASCPAAAASGSLNAHSYPGPSAPRWVACKPTSTPLLPALS